MKTRFLAAAEFDARVENGTCRIALVGMSNGGKSYRSRMLRNECGFVLRNIDAEILKALSLSSMKELSAWLGYPTTKGYEEREARYLALEDTYTRDACTQAVSGNMVLDTTGSVVHLRAQTLDDLRKRTFIVHIDVGDVALSDLIERYFKEPKPVAWGEFFTRGPGESEEDALRRSYPILLEERLKRYRALAHVNIPARTVRDTSGLQTLAIIREYLI